MYEIAGVVTKHS